MTNHISSTALRVRPRIWIGLAIYIGYVVVVFSLQRLSGILYTDFGDSAGNLFFGAGVSLIVSAVLLAITTSLLGWWRPALFERVHSVRWPIVAPALLVAALLVNALAVDWASVPPAFFAAGLALLLVGFTEEIVTRGLLIVALRSRLREVWVWLLSTLAFSLMHGLNFLAGAALDATMLQMGNAFLAGTLFYILRRTTGSLVWAMVLHGLWDFVTFSIGLGTPSGLAALGIGLNLAADVLGLIVVGFVIRGAKERTVESVSAAA